MFVYHYPLAARRYFDNRFVIEEDLDAFDVYIICKNMKVFRQFIQSSQLFPTILSNILFKIDPLSLKDIQV